MGLIVGIDASRNRSGGAKSHLIGIISQCDPVKNGIKEVHVWAFSSLLDQLPDYPWLIKHNPSSLEKNLYRQLIWQAVSFVKELKSIKCDILFTSCASSLCLFKPMVVLSQDMLSYEPGVMQYFGYSVMRLRLLSILALQNLAFRRSQGVIFLSRYAGAVIQKSCGPLANVVYIPHGVDDAFSSVQLRHAWPQAGERPVRCIYVSNMDMYKHQWVVIEAISFLRELGYDITLKLVGGGEPVAENLVKNAIEKSSDNGLFVERIKSVGHDEIPALLAESDLFVFASSCENMPVTLIEGMAVGLPIACSNRGPMPEVLESGGAYFDPEDFTSIANAIEKVLNSSCFRLSISKEAKNLSVQYTWKQCSDDTFEYISKIYKELNL
jgi:glycosyltransferase involved in cell wall biosynthesis